jgi:putative Ca2+/H+ antiporter (TMEM165/GDT1 family)
MTWVEWLSAGATPYTLVLLAEMGDKSQLVCMTLAARRRPGPVLAGAVLAFLGLNTLAVMFGAALTLWIPEMVIALAVAVLFAFFGFRFLSMQEGQEEAVAETRTHGIVITAFLMIFMAEMGDKTQIAVAGMASTLPALAVWTGATLALLTTTALGVTLGQRLLTRIPLHRLHQASGVFFLVLAGMALGRAL